MSELSEEQRQRLLERLREYKNRQNEEHSLLPSILLALLEDVPKASNYAINKSKDEVMEKLLALSNSIPETSTAVSKEILEVRDIVIKNHNTTQREIKKMWIFGGILWGILFCAMIAILYFINA